MIGKKITFSSTDRSKILKAINAYEAAVVSTLGPNGKRVIINDGTSPIVTKDGVTVAKAIAFNDKIMDTYVSILKESALKTNKEAGDGPQPLYAKVLTPKGWVEMGSLKVGDEICGTNKTIQKVEGIFPKGEKEIVEIHFSDGRVVECCEDHLWEVYNSSRYNKEVKKEIKTVKELAKKYKHLNKTTNKYQYFYGVEPTPVELLEKALPLDPFTLGVLIGDGSLSGTGEIELALGFKKEHIIQKLKLPEDCEVVKSTYPNKKCFRLKLKGKQLKEILTNLNLYPILGENKYIPQDYLNASFEQRQALFEGLVATDGHINKRGLVEYSTISNQLKDDVIYLFNSFGKSVTYTYHQRKEGDGSYSKKPIHKIIEAKGCKKGLKIQNIVYTNKKTEMMCIKVSNNDHLYITDNFIPTHNTTSSTLISCELVKEGFKKLDKGFSAKSLIKGMEAAKDALIKVIRGYQIPVKDENDLKKVAMVSSNGDEECANTIVEAFSAIGENGVVTIQDSFNDATSVVTTTGLEVAKGFLSSTFVNNDEERCFYAEDPIIYISQKALLETDHVFDLLNYASQRSKELVLIAPKFGDGILPVLTQNVQNGILKACAINTPGFNQSLWDENTKDLAIALNCKVANEKEVKAPPSNLEDYLGTCKSIKIYNNKTVFIDIPETQEFEEHIEKLTTKLKEMDQDHAIGHTQYEKDKLKERIARLAGGVSTIFVGGITDIELIEKKHRYEDAANAVRVALAKGVIPGGGLSLYKAALSSAYNYPETKDKGISEGFNLVLDVCKKQVNQILINMDFEESSIITFKTKISHCWKKLTNLDGPNMMDAPEYNSINYYEEGILDPLVVVEQVLKNSVSVASSLLSADCLITDDMLGNISLAPNDPDVMDALR